MDKHIVAEDGGREGGWYAASEASYPFAREWSAVGDVLARADVLGPKEYVRWDTRDLAPGDVLPPSRQWRDGEPTGRLLSGVSVLNPRARFAPVDLATQYNGRVYVIRGRIARKGQDPGELILHDAVVVRPYDAPPGAEEAGQQTGRNRS